MKKLEVIEFLKGYSIFTIILFHYLQVLELPAPFGQLIFFGGTGVHLFVLLSGFGLYLSYSAKPLPYIQYLKKRLSKIYLPYIIVVLISAAIAVAIPIYNSSLYALGGHILLYKMFDEEIMGSYGYPLWFVSMILQFYLTFYVLAFLSKVLSLKGFLIFSLLISFLWIGLVIELGKESERVWNSFFLRYLWEFALGMAIAGLLIKNNFSLQLKIKPLYLLITGIVNCALYAFLALKGGHIGSMINDLPALIGYTCIALWIFRLGLPPVNSFFVFAGKISFSLYLLHTVVLLVILHFTNMQLLSLMIALACTFMLALIYTKAIDKLYKRIGV